MATLLTCETSIGPYFIKNQIFSSGTTVIIHNVAELVTDIYLEPIDVAKSIDRKKKIREASIDQIRCLALERVHEIDWARPHLIRLTARSSPPRKFSFYQGDF